MIERLHLRITGVVQGVGFRPFVYGLALRWQLAGCVGNDSRGVFLEIEGPPAALADFQRALTHEAPPLARIESVLVQPVSVQGETGFRIVESLTQPGEMTLVSPDLSLCDDCLRELLDPTDRRYRYPFINCTHCGPRYTITLDLPYDRPFTTMAGFTLCPDCAAEYHDPLNRRFHAQPIACPVCGPVVWYEGGSDTADGDAIGTAQRALLVGLVVAVKGLGGFHLACDATRESAVDTLRQRKRREEKPLAVMVADLDAAQEIAFIDADEAVLLTGRERPIVLLRQRSGSVVSPHVTGPHNPYIGVMLPYTPLHVLLLQDLGVPLVMTSGNLSGEPIITGNDDARAKLGEIADGFLMHDRDIYTPCDDSVIRRVEGREYPIRRSRGYAPLPVRLPQPAPPLVAVGGELKNTFCITRGDYAFMSQHIGDMENLETLTAFEAAFEHMTRLFRVQPEAVVCDLHPGYLSTRWAKDYAARRDLPLIAVQHHHAHIAAVMSEHGIAPAERVIGFSFDGTGYGPDGAIWGGEVLLATYAGYERAAHLAYVPLAGGDLSVKRPYRMALAHLWAADVDWDEDLPPVAACPEAERRVLRHQLETGLNSLPTSSMGRLFDAAAALIGVQQIAHYEAQAAMALEGLALPVDSAPYAYALHDGVIDPGPVLRGMIAEGRAGVPVGHIAGHFHAATADLIARLAESLRASHGLHTVALSGGVFQNVLLLGLAQTALQARGFRVLTHQRVPANDAGLALGQAAVGCGWMPPSS